LKQAQVWVREQDLSVDDTLSYMREFEHMTLSRMFIALYKRDGTVRWIREAQGLLERLLQSAEAGGRIGNVIEILVLQALAYQAQGNFASAAVPLEHALNLAEPEGYIRIFADEGKPMKELLTNVFTKDAAFRLKEYILKLLSAFDMKNEYHPVSTQPLAEPLHERELEVLRLLRTDLSGPEIARKCMVSLSTIRTHTQNIYAKLGVNNRRAAVHRAEELDLF